MKLQGFWIRMIPVLALAAAAVAMFLSIYAQMIATIHGFCAGNQ